MAKYKYDSRFDFNQDGKLDDTDIDVFKSYYYKHVDPNDPISVMCDLNGDGFIDGMDFSLISRELLPIITPPPPEQPKLFIWLPWEGPPLPRNIFPPWPWYKG